MKSSVCTETAKRILRLPLKAEYFDAIKSGAKKYEYRRMNDYWRKRIEGREYDAIVLTKGYPKASDKARHLERPWRAWHSELIEHPLFGDQTWVYAIPVNV